MTNAEFEFDELQDLNFVRIGRKCIWSAIALTLFAFTNIYILVAAPNGSLGSMLSGNLLLSRLVISILLIFLSLFAALRLKKAASGFFQITKTRGQDISLLLSSNKKLAQAFTSLTYALIVICVRWIWVAPDIVNLSNCISN